MTRPLRKDGRRANQLRPLKITPGYIATADGSCLIELGGTRVICTAMYEQGVPDWLAGSGKGWVTAEYGMLPASTPKRKRRAADGRAAEIQRLIGRTLRAVVALDRLGENSFYLDCDVITADGGTRTAAITGAYVALAAAVARKQQAGLLGRGILTGPVAAVSVGLVNGRAVLDLDYSEDVAAEVDMNVAMVKAAPAAGRGKPTRGLRFVEVQGASERAPFDEDQLQAMLALARRGIGQMMAAQEQALKA
jgi:ribonuclease PH